MVKRSDLKTVRRADFSIQNPILLGRRLTCLFLDHRSEQPQLHMSDAAASLLKKKYIYILLWIIFKVFTEFVAISLLFDVLVFGLQGVWDLSSLAKGRTHTSSLKGGGVLTTGPRGRSQQLSSQWLLGGAVQHFVSTEKIIILNSSMVDYDAEMFQTQEFSYSVPGEELRSLGCFFHFPQSTNVC